MTNRPDHDAAIQIRNRLAESSEIDPFTVGVDVKDGIVRLHGWVGSFAERLSALELAAGVVPQERIQNDLEVRPYGADWKVPDEDITAGVRRGLDAVLADSDSVDVRVDHHVVTLHGRVASAASRAVARHVAESVPGVNFVHNEITI